MAKVLSGKWDQLLQRNHEIYSVPKSKKEIVELLQNLLKEERVKCGTLKAHDRGPLGEAVKRLCKICNKTVFWGHQYSILRHLVPEMINLLDMPTTEGGLDIPSALQLCRIPQNLQIKVYQDSLAILMRGGTTARVDYIRNKVLESQKERGVKPLGSPYKDPQKILNFAKKLFWLSRSLAAEKSQEEYSLFLRAAFMKMEKSALKALRKDIQDGLANFRVLDEHVAEELARCDTEKESVKAQIIPNTAFIPTPIMTTKLGAGNDQEKVEASTPKKKPVSNWPSSFFVEPEERKQSGSKLGVYRIKGTRY